MEIDKIRTIEGREIPIKKFTVLVGPNNVGKSQTLKDIHEKLTKGVHARPIVVKEVIIKKPESLDLLFSGLDRSEDPDNIGHHIVRGISSNLMSGEKTRLSLKDYERQFSNSDNLDFALRGIGKYRVSYLDAESRLKVARGLESHNPQQGPPQNLLQALFEAGRQTEYDLREVFNEIFGMDIRLDYSGMTHLAMRVAKEFGEIPEDPREAHSLFSQYPTLDDQGDGFRSFVGVVLSLLLSQGRIVLLDEPEAFLHPAQARQLGNWIAEHANSMSGQILVATHNANFLSGILSSKTPVEIFRINRTNDSTMYVRIPPEATADLANSPLLSSQRVLEAIFFRGVVVCEADADRAVYQTVASRISLQQDVLFIHAHNKQSIPKVVELLRSAQIPTIAIADLDTLSMESDFSSIINALDPKAEGSTVFELRDTVISALGDQSNEKFVLNNLAGKVEEFLDQLKQDKHDLSGARGALNRLRKEAATWHKIKLQGIQGFPDTIKETALKLLDDCKKYGLYLVPVGELEGWIKVGTTRKNEWIVRALEELHKGQSSPQLDSFVQEILMRFTGQSNPKQDQKETISPKYHLH